MVIEDFKKN